MQGKQELKIKGGTKTEEFKIHWIPQCVKKKKNYITARLAKIEDTPNVSEEVDEML